MAARAPSTHIEAVGTPHTASILVLVALDALLRRAKGMVANWPSAWERLSVLPPDPVLA